MLISYLLIRLVTLPFAFLPYRVIHVFGNFFGLLTYYLFSKYRKRALSNLAGAFNLKNHEIRKIAKKSLQSLMITCLEYPKLARETDISRIVTSINSKTTNQIMDQGKGVIFFCGHQANWEILFLEGTSRMPGVAIGRPIKNRYLYAWIQKMRQKFGGTIITPQNAIKEGLRALKRGAFLGVVGDQGMPSSGFCSPFFGRNAFTSPMPALIAYKTQTPIVVATTYRENGRYFIHHSNPIYPNPKAEKKQEVRRLMEKTLYLYESSIRDRPEQWLWVHNRWKQQNASKIKRPYRQDIIACFLPDDPILIKNLPKLRSLYPTEYIATFIPKKYSVTCVDETHSYTNIRDSLYKDLRFKLIINLTGDSQIDRYYKKIATTILSVKTFEEVEKRVLHA